MANLRAQMEAVTFQPVPGGYVFREPFRLSSKAQYYLVDDAQKAQLLALTIPRRPVLWQIALWGTLCAMVAIACVAIWLYTGHGDPTATDTIGMIVLTIAQIIVGFVILRWWKLRRLRPVLATLEPTDLRLTQKAMRDGAANVMSAKQLVIAGVSSTFAATAALINCAIQIATRQPIGLLWLVIGLVFAGLAALWFTRLLRRAETAGPR
jgi:hypothetical protein